MIIDHISDLYIKKKLKEKFIKAIKPYSIIKNIDKIKINDIKRDIEIYSYCFTLQIPTNIKLENIPFNEVIKHDNIYYNNITGVYNKIRKINNKLCSGNIFVDDQHYFSCLYNSCNDIKIEEDKLFLLFKVYTNIEI